MTLGNREAAALPLTKWPGLVVLLVALLPRLLVAGEARPAGENCSLVSPPAEAGEGMNHGVVVRIHPRAKDIGPGYTGCQAAFLQDAGQWRVVFLTEVADGDPVRIWSEDEQDAALACRYRNGKVTVGDPDMCPAAEFLLVRSMAPGCVRLVNEAVVRQGLGARFPAQCEYQ